MPETLFQLDISSIQQYILGAGPAKLKSIRGASFLLTECSETTWPRLLTQFSGSRTIVAGGGNLLGVTGSGDDAEAFAVQAKRALTAATGVVKVRMAQVPYKQGEFPSAFRRLGEALAAEKAVAGPSLERFPAYSYCAQCEACGAVPAVEADRLERQLVCRGCSLRLAAGRTEMGLPFAEKRPADFVELASHSRPANYIAFLYLDFDGMGGYFQSAAEEGEENFAEASRHFDRCTRAALERAAEGVPSVEPLLLGGDDAAIVVPAQYWIPFLAAFRAAFSEEFKIRPVGLRATTTPTFSAGVVIAHSHFPIAELFSTAKVLLQSAKRIGGETSVDFETYSSSTAGDPIAARHQTAERGEGRQRTAKPYRLTELERLAAQLGELKPILPANKRNQLYHLAYGGVSQSQIDYLYLLSRLEGGARRRLQREDVVGRQLWRPPDENGSVRTRACDLVELMEFL